MLSFVSFINRSGAMVICFLTLYLTEKLHFSLIDAGYMMSMYGVGAIIGAYFGGQWTDRFGYHKVQLLTLIGNGIMLLFLMLQRDFWAIGISLFVLNVVSEAFRPANSVSIKANSDEETLTRSYSLLRVLVNLAITFALSVGGWLITYGWEFIFWADAFTCFAAAAFIYFYIPENKNNLAKNIKQKALEMPNLSPYKDIYFLFFIFLTFWAAMVFMQILWTVPTFFKQIYHWDEAKIGIVCAINGFVVMLVELPLIFSIEGKRKNLWMVRFGLLLYTIAHLSFVLPFSNTLIPAVLYMIFISFGEIFVMPFSTTWVTKQAPEKIQGKYLALYIMAYSASNIFAPLFGTQIVANYGFTTLWYVVSITSLLTYIGFFYLEKIKSE
jgi:predicted MFS family arabinose efflux permease